MKVRSGLSGGQFPAEFFTSFRFENPQKLSGEKKEGC